MATKNNHRLILNLSLLGFNICLSFFKIAAGKEIIFGNLDKSTAKDFNVEVYDEEFGDFVPTTIT